MVEATHCDTESVVAQMENIMALRNLHKQVEEGRTHLDISLGAIDAEIEVQHQQLEETIQKCGSLEGVPETAMAELGLEPELELPQIEPVAEPILEPVAEEINLTEVSNGGNSDGN